MSMSKLHPSLPAPVVHNSHMTPSASKSHVLAGVQDAYWSDEEAEDEDCPLCLEEMDLSDLNFKPCPCGYQICRFCWHHIKENLNGRCPACRREYSDEAVQFKPVNKEDLKRLTQQKKQRERERKDLDALGRRHLTNVRIVQRNVVYVVGLGSRYAKEELIPTLRSNDYFGQYGRITKILLVKRTPPGGRAPILGLYISYYRREDAARAIQIVDGAPSPSGGDEVMRASYGTTKYCIAFLRGVSCTNRGCMDLHEWGDEKDCFTKEDLTTLKHTMKDSENRQRSGVGIKRSEEGADLPRSAGWGTKPALGPSSAGNAGGSSARGTRRGHRTTRTGAVGEPRTQQAPSTRQGAPPERRQPAKPSSQASSSRPSTPSIAGLPQRPASPASALQAARQKQRKDSQNPLPPRSPTSSVAVESDAGSGEAVFASPSLSAPRVATPPVSTTAAPPGLPAVPPGLGTPPPSIATPSTAQTSSPLIREASTSSYQISTQAQALLDDVMNRREALPSSTSLSPFPDLDRTLQNLTGGDGDSGGFNFNLDPKLAVDDEQFDTLPDLDSDQALSPGGHFDPFSDGRPVNNASPFYPPPGLSHGVMSSRALYESFKAPGVERTASSSSGYTGSFNPFGEAPDTPSHTFAQRPSPAPDDETSRRVSRFGFARERQSSSGFLNSGTSSPLLSANTSLSSLSLAENANPPSGTSSHAPWPFQRQHEFPPPPGLGMPTRTGTPGSTRGSPLVSYAHAQVLPHSIQSSYAPQTTRFQPFDMGSSEQSLKDVLGIGRGPAVRTTGASDSHNVLSPSRAPFQDPAIMSSVPYVSAAGNDGGFHFSPPDGGFSSGLSQSKPPGLSLQHGQQFISQQNVSFQGQVPSSLAFANGLVTSPMIAQGQSHNQGPLVYHSSPPSFPASLPAENKPAPEPNRAPSPMLSAADFPALPTASASSDTHSQPRTGQSALQTRDSSPVKDETIQTKSDRKAAKKAEKAAERERIAKEKAAERERITKEKAEQRERATREKAEEKERQAKQKAEKERLAKEKAEREAEKERLEKERLLAMRKAEADKAAEKAAKNKAQAKAKQSQKGDSAERVEGSRPATSRTQSSSATVETASPMPILSKMPKKNRPTTKPIRIPKEEDAGHDPQSVPSAVTANSESVQLPTPKLPNVSEVARSSLETDTSSAGITRESSESGSATRAKSVAELLEEIDVEKGQFYLDTHPFFDTSKINSATKTSLDYNTMARALSAFPVTGAVFTEDPSPLNDKTVASFQQLLETLTQTMSDLVQLLPQSTWGSIFDVLSQDLKNLKHEYALHSSTSFDGLVHDDLPEDAEDDEDLDAESLEPLTPTVDKRAKWMEIQLAKLEELHREVNLAAVRTILASNDQGWDPHGFLPHVGNTLARFDQLGMVDEGGHKRPMTSEELEKKLVVAKEAAVFAEAELREAMQAMLVNKP